MSLITSPTCPGLPLAGAASGSSGGQSGLGPHRIDSGTASGLRRWGPVHLGITLYLRRRCWASVGRSIRLWSTTEPTSFWQAPGIDTLVLDSSRGHGISVGSIHLPCYPCPAQLSFHHSYGLHLVNYLSLCRICHRTNRWHSRLLRHFWSRLCVVL